MFFNGTKVKLSQSGRKNECYEDFKNKTLIVTGASNSGRGYDKGLFPMYLYDLEDLQGNEIPCSLYQYELVRVF